jgi:ABC-type glycerol-3-phosphate transport system permease component
MISVTWATLVLFVGLFGGILASLEVGYRIGRNKSRMNPERAFEGTGAMEAAIFSLLGLLLAFSFSGATSRFDARRQLIVQEANTIATAYQRLDLLPVADQPELRQLFRQYLDARLQGFQKILDRPAADEEFARAARIEQQIWSQSLAAGQADPTHNVARLLLPGLNQMSDVANMRTIALETYMPELIFWLLVCVTLMCGVLAGYAMARRLRRSWLHILLFSAIISLTVTVMFDFNYPRYGLIRVDTADNVLLQLRDSMR